jgi:hypothetical protein
MTYRYPFGTPRQPIRTVTIWLSGEEEEQPIGRKSSDSHARYRSNLLPVDLKRSAKTSPIFNYPYAETRHALEQMSLLDVSQTTLRKMEKSRLCRPPLMANVMAAPAKPGR